MVGFPSLQASTTLDLHHRCSEKADYAMARRSAVAIIDAGIELMFGAWWTLDTAPRHNRIHRRLGRRIHRARLIGRHGKAVSFANLAHPFRIDRSTIVAAATT